VKLVLAVCFSQMGTALSSDDFVFARPDGRALDPMQ
jgi:hypothetical protein